MKNPFPEWIDDPTWRRVEEVLEESRGRRAAALQARLVANEPMVDWSEFDRDFEAVRAALRGETQ